jgi:hypothetical protein
MPMGIHLFSRHFARTIDDVIMPHAIRKRLARALAMLQNKHVEVPSRKHDNLPVLFFHLPGRGAKIARRKEAATWKSTTFNALVRRVIPMQATTLRKWRGSSFLSRD